MDRTPRDDSSSDVVVAEPSAAESRTGGRDMDRIYRRPDARPIAGEPGSSWFAGGADAEPSPWTTGEMRAVDAERPWTTGEMRAMPPDEDQRAAGAAPEFGPATPGSSSRVSYGFTAGPISPNRQVAAPVTAAPPTPDPAPAPDSADSSSFGAVDWPAPTSADWTSPTRAPGETSGGVDWPPPARMDPADLERVPGRRPPAGLIDEPVRRTPSDLMDGPVRRAPSDPLDGPGRRAPSDPLDGPIRRAPADPIDDRPIRREPPAPLTEEPRRQSRFVTAGIIVLSAIVLLAGTVVGVVYFSGSDGELDNVLELGAGDAKGRTVSAPLDNRTKASFELLAGANRVNVTIGELGDDLYRISTPEDAGIRPSPEIRQDDVKLQVTRDGDGTGGEIDVVLSAKVRWAVRIAGYVEQQVIDLSLGQISGIEMVAGSRSVRLSLPQPSGTVPMKVNGAVDQLVVKAPTGNPVRARLDGGAQTVVAGSRTLRDVPAGSTLTPKNWATQNRYDVTAGARITSLTVENA